MSINEITIKEHLIQSYNVMILGIVYLIFGLTSSYIINNFSPIIRPNESKLQLGIEICIEVAITILFAYIIHQIIENIPLPMAGSTENQLQTIREVRGGIIIAFSMFALQTTLRNKIQLLFFGHIENFIKD